MSYSEIPDQVRNFIRDLQNAMDTRNVSAILQYYETDWTKMTERYFKSSPWPHWTVVEGMCGADNIFILFYKGKLNCKTKKSQVFVKFWQKF